jgi:hypothetical protein
MLGFQIKTAGKNYRDQRRQPWIGAEQPAVDASPAPA